MHQWILSSDKCNYHTRHQQAAKPKCGPVEEAGFVKVALGALFQSGPKVAVDEHLEEEGQINKVCLIQY